MLNNMKEVTIAASLLALHEKNTELRAAIKEGDLTHAHNLTLHIGFGLLVASTMLLDKDGQFDVA